MSASTATAYRDFIATTLRPVVADRTRDLAAVSAKKQQLEELAASLAALRAAGEAAGGGPARLLVDVGAGFHMQARVDAPAAAAVYVDVGTGYFVEMTLPEAEAVVSRRVTRAVA